MLVAIAQPRMSERAGEPKVLPNSLIPYSAHGELVEPPLRMDPVSLDWCGAFERIRMTGEIDAGLR